MVKSIEMIQEVLGFEHNSRQGIWKKKIKITIARPTLILRVYGSTGMLFLLMRELCLLFMMKKINFSMS